MAKILLSTTPTLKPNYLIKRQPFFVRAPGCGLGNNPLERVLDFPNVDNRARSYLQGNSSSRHSPVTAVLASDRGTWHQSCSRRRPGNPRRTRFCIQNALMPLLHPGRTPGPLRTVKVRLRCPCPVLGNRFSLDSLFRVSVLGKGSC